MQEDVILKMEHISKTFPGVKALDDVSFELKKGEVHAICGENGAGKSTLLKILTGIYKKDDGEIYINGKEVNIRNIQHARQLGVGTIPQEIQMAPKLSVAENMFMACYPKKLGIFVDWEKMKQDTRKQQEKLGGTAVGLGIDKRVEAMSMGHKQLIEIMKALSTEAEIIAFDEPTSSLSEEEAEQLFKLISDLKGRGKSIIYVSHKLKEIFTICDSVTVLKDGKYVGKKAIRETDVSELISMMVGRNLDLFEKKAGTGPVQGEVVLEVKGLARGNVVKGVDFSVKKGEILGLFGIVGSGRTETARMIFGLDEKTSGEIYIHGKKVEMDSPEKAVSQKIGFVTEDRHGEGLSLRAPLRWNISLPFIEKLKKVLFIQHDMDKKCAVDYINKLQVKTPGDLTLAEDLSGGNQQKVVIAKWLGAESRILIFDEPTRGIDVGSKSEIYKLIKSLAEEGKSVIMISSELPEILALSDRILVFREGLINAEITNSELLKEEDILKYAIMQ